MGLFKTKVRHEAMSATDAFAQAFGPRDNETFYWNIWMPKFPLKGERNQCFVGRLFLVDGKAHLELDGVDYGPVSEHSEALQAIAEYGGQSCPAVLSITKPTAENFHISVPKLQARQTG